MQIGSELMTSQDSKALSYMAMDVVGHMPIKKIACTSKGEYIIIMAK